MISFLGVLGAIRACEIQIVPRPFIARTACRNRPFFSRTFKSFLPHPYLRIERLELKFRNVGRIRLQSACAKDEIDLFRPDELKKGAPVSELPGTD